jgi:hypothetical protein
MGTDPVHLTEVGYKKLSEGVLQMAEGLDTVFSGGNRAHEDEEFSPPVMGGRKQWIYGGLPQGRGGNRGGYGGRGGISGNSGSRGGNSSRARGASTSGYSKT